MLFDRDLTTGPIFNFLSGKPPVFCFLNACETASERKAAMWKDRYDIFGLARACLETGAYLIGNRWEVGDEAASAFAGAFYMKLMTGGTLGGAVREGGLACRQASYPEDFSWASYILYGDPRLCFKQVP